VIDTTAVDKINPLSTQPEFLVPNGHLTHESKPKEFAGMDQILKSAPRKRYFLRFPANTIRQWMTGRRASNATERIRREKG
jgi:hypothetical protein